ncbi:unnamed protein product [Rotaria sordida]|uniref:Uncharacterized protein n=1 Tax=Rotaria sordida TaxID=392033 RepID=A0A814FDG8_9BILA|nr:unnamed protein product [Rotaria sordida]
MSTLNSTPKLCHRCTKDRLTSACDGCHVSFCVKHLTEHQQELYQTIDNISEENDSLKRELSQRGIEKILLEQIDTWEKETINKIRSTAKTARTDIKQLTEESTNRLISIMNKLSNELHKNQKDHQYIEDNLNRWTKQIEELKKELQIPPNIESFLEDDSTIVRLIKIKSSEKIEPNQTDPSPQTESRLENRSSKIAPSSTSPSDSSAALNKSESIANVNISSSQSSFYPSLTFGFNQSSNQVIQQLFEYLMRLDPMNKNGPMSGPCGHQTDQMEKFLSQTFGFRNIPGEYIVQGVRSFKLDNSVSSLKPETEIRFPSNTTNSFAMSVQEIMNWQRSYRVYADNNIRGMNKEFLKRALQGKSEDGEEAFRMKFVVRISTCPILMEFDAKIIRRNLNENWPNRIKLVSVTGIDFAGRKHDVGDILYYVSNWREIYEMSHIKDEPALLNERDFRLKKLCPAGELHQKRLLNDLIHMARLRLRACDAEGVQIVVETGIGLGVFAGEHIGVDETVRITAAIAIRAVLEQDGSSYKNIRGIVFALPIIDVEKNSTSIRDTFSEFVEHFQEPPYNSPIPVMIADQDMHRLTVAIARQGFIVSELNPADSHGVFGEYWQNRGPAVEEKLALTTVGLLVQHHLINPHVLNTNNYYFI